MLIHRLLLPELEIFYLSTPINRPLLPQLKQLHQISGFNGAAHKPIALSRDEQVAVTNTNFRI